MYSISRKGDEIRVMVPGQTRTLKRVRAPKAPIRIHPRPPGDPAKFRMSKLKVTRAREHLRSLTDTINAYYGTAPMEHREENDPVTRTLVVSARCKSAPPDQISAILGDLMNNLRSALDLLLCDLVRLNGADVKRAHSFPILAEEAAAFPREARKKTFGISPKAFRLICRLRPHNHGNHLLRALRDFDNANKHTGIIVVAASTAKVQINIEMPGAYITPHGTLAIGPRPQGYGQPITTGPSTVEDQPAVLLTDEFQDVFRAIPGVRQEYEVGTYVAFAAGQPFEKEPVPDVSQMLINHVDTIIGMVERVCT